MSRVIVCKMLLFISGHFNRMKIMNHCCMHKGPQRTGYSYWCLTSL